MDTRGSDGTGRRLPRILTTAALVCFALPFLTVTCYGETTVSGVQAATGIDISPNGGQGERELAREEGANGFALVALVAAAAGVALSLGRAHSRLAVTLAAAVGVFAIEGFALYAFYRTWGEAYPRIGFVGALMCLVGAAWAGAGRVPRWVGWATVGVAAAMVPAAVIGPDGLHEVPLLAIPVFAGWFIAPALVTGAIGASARPPDMSLPALRPSTLRIAAAGIVGIAFLAAGAVGGFLLMGAMVSGEYAPDGVGSGYTFAIVVVAMTIAASMVAWIAGGAIVHGRRRAPFVVQRSEAGA
jgi:hypothetical protein